MQYVNTYIQVEEIKTERVKNVRLDMATYWWAMKVCVWGMGGRVVVNTLHLNLNIRLIKHVFNMNFSIVKKFVTET